MKREILLLLGITLIVNSNAQNLSGLTAWLQFDGNFIESVSGLKPDSANILYNYTDGPFGAPANALNIHSGSLDYGDTPFSRLDTSDFSIVFWFKGDGGSGLWPLTEILMKNTVPSRYGFVYNGNQAEILFQFKPDDDSTMITKSLTPNLYGDTAWMHIAITADRDSTIKHYYNSRFSGSAYIGHYKSLPCNIPGASLLIGNHDMALDEIMFFNRVLTQNEIDAIYQNSVHVSEKIKLDHISIYPNPASTHITLEGVHASDIAFSFYNTEGKTVLSGEVTEPSINVSTLPAGSYFLSLRYNGQNTLTKILID